MCRKAHKLLKSRVSSEEAGKLKEAISFLGMEVTPEQTRSLANLIGWLGLGTGILLIFIISLFLGFSVLWLLFLAFPTVLYLYFRRYPILKADSEMKRGLAQIPEAMSYLLMSLRVNPNLECAVEFAASHSRDIFRRRFGRIIQDVNLGRNSIEAGLAKLGNDFAKRSEEFRRSMSLVLASMLDRTERRRQETLDKASAVLLDGLALRNEREARALNTPVMIVFTFGILLPLILVAIIPFTSLMGIEISTPVIALIYTFGLPLFLYILIRFIASCRPVTMLPPRVPAGNTRIGHIILGVSAGLLPATIFLLGDTVLGSLKYVPILLGIGTGTGTFMLLTTAGVRKVRREIKSMENRFGEILHHLGVILSEGRPLEVAMIKSESPFMKRAAENIRTLNASLKSAFFDRELGSLRTVYSDTIRGIIEVLVSIADKGPKTLAKVSFRMAEHVNNLKKSGAEVERGLGSVISSMRIIALIVAPLVGGMISSMSVVLAETMVKSQGENLGFGYKTAMPMDPSIITMVIGIYIMESAVILMLFGSELINGDDIVMKKYYTGLALPLSIIVFTVCAWVTGNLFGSIA